MSLVAQAMDYELENPFTTEYLKKEIQFYDPKPYNKNGLVFKLKPIRGVARIDEYLNKAVWGAGPDMPDIPVLTFNNTVWMSLTWMEVQSFWVPLNYFGGDILTGGLGMGYAALRFAAHPNVDSVTVYEIDQRVIDFFKETQGTRPEMDKIRIIHEDVHRAQGRYDFAFIDIYPTLLPDELLRDARFFCLNCPEGLSIMETPHFWGQELAWFTLMLNRTRKKLRLPDVERDFFRFWQQSRGELEREITDVSFCLALAKMLGMVED